MKLIALFIAIALAAICAVFAYQMFNKEEPAKQVVVQPQIIEKAPPTVDVLVAKTDIPIGTVIEAEMLDLQPWPQNLLLPQFVSAAKDSGEDPAGRVLKMVTRTPFQAGEPIILSKLANPSDPSFIAANLPKGMRALTIRTDMFAGAAGFALPGDRVDVVYTYRQPLKTPKPGKAADEISEVLVQNVKILALNQFSTYSSAPQAEGKAEKGPPQPNSVTIEVTQEDAQRIRLAESQGKISLTVRSLEDRDDLTVVEPVKGDNISKFSPKANESAADAAASVRIIRGVYVEKVELPTGTPLGSMPSSAESELEN